MDSTQPQEKSNKILLQILGGLLLLIVLVFSLFTMFAIMQIVVFVTSVIVARTIEMPLQQNYIVGTARNAWVVCGGALWLGFIIGASDYFSKRLAQAGTRRFLIRALMFELSMMLVAWLIMR